MLELNWISERHLSGPRRPLSFAAKLLRDLVNVYLLTKHAKIILTQDFRPFNGVCVQEALQDLPHSLEKLRGVDYVSVNSKCYLSKT